MKVFNICLQSKSKLQKSELKTLLGSVPKFQIVASATKRKKDHLQFLGLRKQACNLGTMEEFFDDDRQQYTPFLPTCTPIVLGF